MLIDVSQRLGIAESFLLVSAPSSRQVRAIAEEIMDEIGRDYHIIPQRIEGRREGTWVLADYGDVVIHVMRHGEVDNPDGILYGRLPGYGLTDLGLEMAEAVAEYFVDSGADITHVVASPLLRAQMSAAPTALSYEL